MGTGTSRDALHVLREPEAGSRLPGRSSGAWCLCLTLPATREECWGGRELVFDLELMERPLLLFCCGKCLFVVQDPSRRPSHGPSVSCSLRLYFVFILTAGGGVLPFDPPMPYFSFGRLRQDFRAH